MTHPEAAAQPVEGFLDRHYSDLVQQGFERIGGSPISMLDAACTGDVVWRDGQIFSGHRVERLWPEYIDTEFAARMERIGFTKNMLTEGVWSVHPTEYTPDPNNNSSWKQTLHAGPTTSAHYNGTNWHVMRAHDGFSEEWEDQWQKPETDLTPTEKRAIERVAKETEFVFDAAVTFEDHDQDYYEFTNALARRAAASGPLEQQAAAVLLRAHEYRHRIPYDRLMPVAYHLGYLAKSLYNDIVAGKVTQETICPPYERTAAAA